MFYFYSGQTGQFFSFYAVGHRPRRKEVVHMKPKATQIIALLLVAATVLSLFVTAIMVAFSV